MKRDEIHMLFRILLKVDVTSKRNGPFLPDPLSALAHKLWCPRRFRPSVVATLLNAVCSKIFIKPVSKCAGATAVDRDETKKRTKLSFLYNSSAYSRFF